MEASTQRCEHRYDSGRSCSFLPYWRVSVGTRTMDAQLSCKRHLAHTCELLYASEGRRHVRIVVIPL